MWFIDLTRFCFYLPHCILCAIVVIHFTSSYVISTMKHSLFSFLFIFWPHCVAFQVFVPQPGIEPEAPQWKFDLNHLADKGSPILLLFLNCDLSCNKILNERKFFYKYSHVYHFFHLLSFMQLQVSRWCHISLALKAFNIFAVK